MKVAIYSSIGTKKGQDTEEQLVQLQRHVLSQHREVYLFVDREAGKTGHRAEFQNLIESAARREFQVVLVWALDRFIGASVAEAFGNIQRILRYGVQVVSYTEPHFRTSGPAGALMIPIAAWIAQQERIRISERTKAGLATARVHGKRLGRPWKVLPRRRVATDYKRGMSWRQLERKYHVPQSTLRNVIQKLAEAGVPPPSATGDPSRGGAEEESQ
jgi:DNA invertase Pin-like site-specific DNA recombinase